MNKYIEEAEALIATAIILAVMGWVLYAIITALAAGSMMTAMGLIVLSAVVGVFAIGLIDYKDTEVCHG